MTLQQTVTREESSWCLIKLPNSVEVLERLTKSTNPNQKFPRRYDCLEYFCLISPPPTKVILSDQVGHWQDMQSGLSGGTVDKELLDFEAGLEQEAGARFDKSLSVQNLSL